MNIEPKLIVKFCVLGESHPKGSMKAVPIPSPSGPYRLISSGKRVSIVMSESSKKVKTWMRQIAHEVMAGFRGEIEAHESKYGKARAVNLIDNPLILKVTIERVRPAAHFRANGELKESAPLFPDVQPDLGKVIRAVEDAIEGVLFTNDSRIVQHVTQKQYGDVPQVIIEILALPKTVDEAKAW